MTSDPNLNESIDILHSLWKMLKYECLEIPNKDDVLAAFDVCFGFESRGNTKYQNVVMLPPLTEYDYPPVIVLQKAIEADLEGVVVMGYKRTTKEDEDQEEYISSSYSDRMLVNWLADRVKFSL